MWSNPEASSIVALARRFVEIELVNHPLSSAYLFGSWAYGHPVDGSDIDIAIILDGKATVSLEDELSQDAYALDPRIELHLYTADYFNSARRSIISDIKTKGIPLLP